MKKQAWKADEMEMSINFQSIRAAYIFAILALLADCLYAVIATGELLTVPFIILCASCSLFLMLKAYLTKQMTKGLSDEE